MRSLFLLASVFIFIAGCAVKQVSGSMSYPSVDGVKLVKNATNAELKGGVSGEASCHYCGCGGLAEKAYKSAAEEAKKIGADSIGNVRGENKPSFWVYYWGCKSTVTAEAYVLP